MRGRPAIRQAQVLNYVQSIFADQGHPPSYGMICTALGIRSRTEVSRIVVAQIKIPAKLVPVFEGEADVRGAMAVAVRPRRAPSPR
jgi:hypothetical protein